jgi:SprA family protein
MINTSNTLHQSTYHASTLARTHNAATSEENTDSKNKAAITSEAEHTRKEEQGLKTRKVHSANTKNTIESELSQAEVKQLRDLRARDQEVRAHEQAHAAAAGSLAKGGPSFDYQRGPDGQLYAVGGEIKIDTSAVTGNPEATAAKAAKVKRAALAPAQPSQQDRAVAAAAATLETQARVEIAQQKTEDSAEILNSQFSNEKSNTENEAREEVKTENNIETYSKCAECGGQHSAESHSVSVMLGKTFNQPEVDNSPSISQTIGV